MCDCYNHECEAEGCESVIPMHLGDYMTRRREVSVYCEEHMSAIYGWTGIETQCRVWAYYVMVPDGARNRIDLCGVNYKTENAWDRRDVNYPNAGVVKVVEEI